jgi:hypothetical protein
MNKSTVWLRRTGLGLHGLVGAVMILAGAVKVSGFVPMEKVEAMGLASHIRLIGAGELVSGILLLVPRTAGFGILLTSSFWGGAICLHMSRGESYAAPSVLLLLSWAGTYLQMTSPSFATGPAARQDAVPHDSTRVVAAR